MSVYNLLLIFIWAAFILVWLVTAQSAKMSERGKGMGQWVVSRLLLAIVLVAVFHTELIGWASAAPWRISGSPIVSSLGVALAGAGVAFAIWARLHLGANWGMPMTVRENPELVTSGPYAYVRHPIYTGVLLGILGTALVSGLPWLIVFAVACIYFVYAARQEEKVMQEKFPAEYPLYKERTHMIIPFVL